MWRRSLLIAAVLAAGLVGAMSGAGASILLAENWRDLSPGQRYKALQNYQRHEQLPQDNQQDIERRYQRWQRMSPDERDRIRQNYERLQQLPPSDRERFQRKYEKWRQQGGQSE